MKIVLNNRYTQPGGKLRTLEEIEAEREAEEERDRQMFAISHKIEELTSREHVNTVLTEAFRQGQNMDEALIQELERLQGGD